MTNMLTDDDLTVIEDLDFEPGCDWDDCATNAAFMVSYRGTECTCRHEHFACSGHTERLTWEAVSHALITCLICGADYQTLVIDRIEPLR